MMCWWERSRRAETKFVCAVCTSPHDLIRTEFPTGDRPAQVLSDVTNWLSEQQSKRGTLQAIGIGSFGPVDLNNSSPTYGYITSTPKSGWRNTDIVGAVRRTFSDIPIGFDTDVKRCGTRRILLGQRDRIGRLRLHHHRHGHRRRGIRGRKNSFMGLSTPRWDTCCSGAYLGIPLREHVHFTLRAGKGSAPGRRS